MLFRFSEFYVFSIYQFKVIIPIQMKLVLNNNNIKIIQKSNKNNYSIKYLLKINNWQLSYLVQQSKWSQNTQLAPLTKYITVQQN